MIHIPTEPTLGNTKDCPPLSPAEATGTDWASLGKAAAVAFTTLLRRRMNEQRARGQQVEERPAKLKLGDNQHSGGLQQ